MELTAVGPIVACLQNNHGWGRVLQAKDECSTVVPLVNGVLMGDLVKLLKLVICIGMGWDGINYRVLVSPPL